MKEEDVSLLENMDTGHWYGDNRNKILIEWICKNINKTQRILEIGTGTGNILSIIQLKGYSVEGIEPSISGYTASVEKGLKIENVSLENFKPTKKYDAVLAFDVLEHIENDRNALRYINEILLKPGGLLLLAVPADPRLWSQLDVDVLHYRRYTKKGLVKILNGEKFKIMKWRKWITLLYPLVYFHRKYVNSGYQKENQKPNVLINTTLDYIARLERKISLKFLPGVSLIVLAKKVI
jgi:2-polyprenyl-3-methyl-5-hydroxy-6-metoxy-1,4-benzoquinol methylase